ncbi:MAG TPA: alpha/beta fold hydrolase [Pseudobdellovibrionaceae bacterium]|nr:alpha/beta fold hydrolase [Pseudobdellovibrionaceae bacterium]
MKILYFPGFMDDARDVRHGLLGRGENLGDLRIELRVASPAPLLRGRTTREEVLSAWAHELSRERADLILGYSMGARLAAEILQRLPNLGSRALLLSPHPGLSSDAERQARRQHDRAWAMRFRAADSARAWRRLDRAWNAQGVLQSRQPRFGRWAERFRYARELELLGLATQADHRTWYRQVRGIKVLIGERDAKFRELWRELPHDVVPEAGHRLLVDAPISVQKFCVELLEPKGSQT